jgi:Protein of unknown function (DUF1566)
VPIEAAAMPITRLHGDSRTKKRRNTERRSEMHESVARFCLVAAACALALPAAPALAGPSPATKCEALKDKEAGKYVYCLQKAEMKQAKTKGTCSSAGTECYRDDDCPSAETCGKDTTKYDSLVGKCDQKFSDHWASLEQKAAEAGGSCPTTGDQSVVQTAVADFSACVAGGINGTAGTCDVRAVQTSLDGCTNDLSTCNGSLSTCNFNLTTCNNDDAACLAALYALQNSCNTTLTTVNAGTAAVGDVLSSKTFSSSAGVGVTGTMPNNGTVSFNPGATARIIPAGYYAGGTVAGDADLVSGNIVSGVNIFGVAGTQPRSQPLETGQTTSYVTGDDGAYRYGDAQSYTDNGNGTITDDKTGLMWEKLSDDGSIHDLHNTYTWQGAFTSKIAALNVGSFAGHSDWRLPNVNELQSLVDYRHVAPAIDSAFNTCTANCTILTGSCTQSSSYWSSTSFQNDPSKALDVYFSGSSVLVTVADDKTLLAYVRAVRGGS